MNLRVTVLNKEELISLLTADINKYINMFLKTGIELAKPIVESLSEEAIENFYNSYRSIYYYDRTGNLRNNSFFSICELSGSGAFVGVEISGAKMSEYESGINPSSVVGWTWFGGSHGYPGYAGTHTSFPPISMLQIAIGQAGQDVLKKANKKAQAQRYRVLKF